MRSCLAVRKTYGYREKCCYCFKYIDFCGRLRINNHGQGSRYNKMTYAQILHQHGWRETSFNFYNPVF